jgi:hypothetical protein
MEFLIQKVLFDFKQTIAYVESLSKISHDQLNLLNINRPRTPQSIVQESFEGKKWTSSIIITFTKI